MQEVKLSYPTITIKTKKAHIERIPGGSGIIARLENMIKSNPAGKFPETWLIDGGKASLRRQSAFFNKPDESGGYQLDAYYRYFKDTNEVEIIHFHIKNR
jgi:hypothetical protein